MAKSPRPIPFTQFGGLVLDRSLDEIGADRAADLLDVDWTASPGELRSREGVLRFTTSSAPANYEAIFAHSDSRLLAQRGAVLAAISQSTKEELEDTIEIQIGTHIAFTRFGTPAASYSYIADSINTLRRFDGTNFDAPAAIVDGAEGKAMPVGVFLASWSDGGNRLVVASTGGGFGGPGGVPSGTSHVWFSNPGEPEGFESTAFVELTPGDGEEIVGCCAWGGKIFVFKETKLFVFYGVSADEDGFPIFNYDTVDLGTRILPPGASAERGSGEYIVAGTEGVYFVSNDGLWATTGGVASSLSEDLSPLAGSRDLVGPAAATIGDLRWTNMLGICYFDNAIYVGLGTDPIELLFKFDLRILQWTVWGAALNAMAVWNEEVATHRSRIFFSASAAGLKDIYFYTPEADVDPTSAMTPYWQPGFYDLEEADEKTLVHLKAWGTGEIDVEVADDFGAVGAATKLVLGAAPAIAQKQVQKGQGATLFSHRISGDAPWSLQRIDRYLRETREPETQQ